MKQTEPIRRQQESKTLCKQVSLRREKIIIIAEETRHIYSGLKFSEARNVSRILEKIGVVYGQTKPYFLQL